MIPVTVTFYGDVGFDRSYNHVIDFTNETERESYFTPKILKTVADCAYNKPLNTIQLKCNYEEALKFTYCKFVIGSNTSHQKKIFAWVDDVVLVTDQKDENNTYVPILSITIAVDPWQTFLFDFTIGESFVVREHVDRFKANSDGSKGWSLPNTSDDNSVGANYRNYEMCDFRPLRELVTVGNKVDITAEMYWLVIQRVVSGQGITPYMQVLYVPCCDKSVILRPSRTVATEFVNLMIDDILQDRYLGVMGIDPETVASVSFLPVDIGEYERVSGNYTFINIPMFTSTFWESSISNNILAFTESVLDFPLNHQMEFTLSISDNLTIPNNDVYSYTHEPQLYKEPYNVISIVDENGIERGRLPDILANYPGMWSKVLIQFLIDSVDVRVRIKPVITNVELDSKYWVEYSVPKVEVIRSNWLSYLLQERETDRQMISSQINQQAIATAIGGVSSAASMGGNAGLGNTISNMKTDADAVKLSSSSVGGAYGGLGLGIGAISTVGGYVANQHFMFEQQDIREKAIKRKANNIIQAGTFKSLVGNFKIIRSKPDATTIDIKAKEFHKYGYSVFFYETPNLKSRKYFNFIATNIVKIEGSLNNNIKMALMEIFNNGVTIWHGDNISQLTGIGDYSKENIERSLL